MNHPTNTSAAILIAFPVVEVPDPLDYSENVSTVEGVEVYDSPVEFSVVNEYVDGHKVTFCTMRPYAPWKQESAFWITLENTEESRTLKLSLQKAQLLRDYLTSPEMTAILAAMKGEIPDA